MTATIPPAPPSRGGRNLEIDNLVVTFPIRGTRGKVHAVDGVTFRIAAGEIVGLVGESGSGKSTIARSIVGLNRPDSGSMLFDERDLLGMSRRETRDFRRSRRLQMIWQDPSGSFDPRMSVRTSLQMGLSRRGEPRRELDARCLEVLRAVGLPESVYDRRPSQLSGGQNQRVAIARALLGKPDLIVADEPTSALDVSVQAGIGNHLVRLNREFGMSILLVSHDLGFVTSVAHEVVVLYLGRVMEKAPSEDIVKSPRHPYTAALLAVTPTLDGGPAGVDRFKLEGEIPSPINPPRGCRFSTRCPFVTERCRSEEPALRELPEGGEVACHYAEELTEQLAKLSHGHKITLPAS